MRQALAAWRHDIHRYAGNYRLLPAIKAVLAVHPLRAIGALRWYQRAWLMRPLAWVIHRHWCQSSGIDLPVRTQIGPGLAIFHGWGVVINEHARLGANVTLFQGVTIGQGDRIDADGQRRTGYPVLEDEVWVGPNALIVGAVTIGRGARILGGAVVHFDVPAGALVGGNPGRILSEAAPPDVTNRAPVA